MSNIERVTRDGIQPEITRPDPSRIVAGDPVHTTWNIEDRDGLYCGLWQSTPGTWRIKSKNLQPSASSYLSLKSFEGE